MEKKLTKIYLRTEKKVSPKVMEGVDEIILILSVPDEINSTSNNKIDDETIEEIYKLLDEDIPVKEIASHLDVTAKTVYNYKKLR